MTLPRFGFTLLLTALLLPAAARAADPAPASPTPMPRTAEGAVTSHNQNEHRHQEFLARIQEAPVDLLFLGDSITDGWPRGGEVSWLKFAPYRPANFGVSGERTEDVLWRITHGELDGIRPKAVVLLIGTNNVGHDADEQPGWVAAGVRKITETIHEKLPDTKLLVLAIFPRDDKASDHRRRCDAANLELAKLDDGDKTRFLDINRVFLKPDGELIREVMPDGLHPNAKGYALWYEAMRPSLEEMMR